MYRHRWTTLTFRFPQGENLRKALKPSSLSLLQLSWAPEANLHLSPPPKASTLPSFLWLQSHWEISTVGKASVFPWPQDVSQDALPDLKGLAWRHRLTGKRQSPPVSPLWELCVPEPPAVILGYQHLERTASVRVGKWQAEHIKTSLRQ